MRLKELSRNWDRLGRENPLGAILAWRADDGAWSDEDFRETGRREVETLLDVGESLERPRRVDRALDFGCGIGRVAQPLAEVFDEVIGVDIAPSMIERANAENRYPDRCRYVRNEVDDLRCIADRSCDLVHTRYVLQHMPPRHSTAYIAEFLRVLVPSGLLVFQLQTQPTAAGAGWVRRSREIVRGCVPRPMLHWYRHVRYGGERAVMERHGVSRSTIERLVAIHGGRILREDHEPLRDPGWASSTYWVTRDE